MQEEKIIDLHAHTVHSDGLFTPEDLLLKARAYGLAALSIADHDTIEAYTKETVTLATQLDVELVPGVEISTQGEKGERYHILGLLIDLTSSGLIGLTREIGEARKIDAQSICKLLRKKGWSVETSTVLNHASPTKAHIARTVLKDTRNADHLLRMFGDRIPTEGEFTEAMLIRGKPFYVTGRKKPNPRETIQIVHDADGLAILAHPSFNILMGEDPSNLCNKFLSLGIDGFEAINVQFDRSHGDAEVEHIELFTEFAFAHGMVISGGSDFHHDNAPLIGRFIDLGFHNDRRKVPYSVLENLKAYKSSRKISR